MMIVDLLTFNLVLILPCNNDLSDCHEDAESMDDNTDNVHDGDSARLVDCWHKGAEGYPHPPALGFLAIVRAEF